MKKQNGNKFSRILSLVVLSASLFFAVPTKTTRAAEGNLDLSVQVSSSCSQAQFDISWTEGSGPYLLYLEFGDGESTQVMELNQNSMTLSHTYPDQGMYEWTLVVVDSSSGGDDGFSWGTITLEGPQVKITTDPFPAVFTAGEGDGQVTFSSRVSGGTPPYSYSWDLDGSGRYEDASGSTASYTYQTSGKHQPRLLVTDSCGLSSSDTIPVVIAEEDQICHPAVKNAANALNRLFPDRSDGKYTCQDVYDQLQGTQDRQFSLGEMLKAYQISRAAGGFNWNDLHDWQLAGGGWGVMVQLDRLTGLMQEQGLAGMAELTLRENYTLWDLGSAVRMVTRYQADFEDALSRSAQGASPGELSRFYQLAQDLGTQPAVLDAYLNEGMSLAELSHAARIAEKMGASWAEVAEAHRSSENWGDINQAYRLATDEISPEEILAIGVKDFRKNQQEYKQSLQQENKNQRTAHLLAEKYGLPVDQVLNLFHGDCQSSWNCVRAELRLLDQQDQPDGPGSKDQKKAQQIASQYGVSVEEVLDHFRNSCGEDWTCTRAYFRDLSQDGHHQDQDNHGQGQEKDKDHPGQGQDKDKDNPGQGKDKDKEKDNPGQAKDKDKGNPGQEKDKDNPGQGKDKDKDKK